MVSQKKKFEKKVVYINMNVNKLILIIFRSYARDFVFSYIALFITVISVAETPSLAQPLFDHTYQKMKDGVHKLQRSDYHD